MGLFVADIFEDAGTVAPYANDETVYSRIEDAVEVLSCEANFDVLHAYLDIAIPAGGNRIVLPRQVETPIKINIDNKPAFTRDKLYEFTLNGPGSNTERVDWQWEDQIPIATQVPLFAPTKLTVNSFPQDDGKTVTFIGLATVGGVAAQGEEITETLTLDADTPPITVNVFGNVLHVHKDETIHPVSALTSPDGGFLAKYSQTDTNPSYRQIVLSKSGVTAHILYRRNRFKITSTEDFIPIRSKMALITMLKALEHLRNGYYDKYDMAKKMAVELASKEQAMHNAFVEVAGQTEISNCRNLSLNNRDTLIVADIWDEACSLIGPKGEKKVMDEITEAASILSNKTQWDAQRGYVDLTTDQYRYVTLPRYVDYPIKINIGGGTATMQNKWFQFNNGACGCADTEDWIPFQSWMDVGKVVTLRDVLYTMQLAVETDMSADSGVQVRIYGWYQGKRLFTNDAQNNAVDGFLVPAATDATGAPTSPVLIDRIERITKSKTAGFVKLVGYDLAGANPVILGYYYPDETEPNYRRIKLPRTCGNIRLMYRRKELKFTSLTDPLHLNSKSAILFMLRAKKAAEEGKLKDAQDWETKAVQYLGEEQDVNNQSDWPELEFDNNFRLRRVGR